MLFNSLKFLLFFPLVCMVYFAIRGTRWRNAFLLLASYFFYMNWKPVYALLILSSTLITYFCGLLLDRPGSQKFKKLILAASIVLNIGLLVIFKYHGMINEVVTAFLGVAGLHWRLPNFDVLLPVGISFYTFQAVGYAIDVYRGTVKAERNFVTYAVFVSFFPQLVAGPIERAGSLLPQFREKHSFNYHNVVEGVRQMLWGFFMKLCVADVLAEYVDAVYNNVSQHNGASMLIATVLFAFQIYCDFGGYSNIAIGAARVMNFRLMENFRTPYLSADIGEFWKRWHISLSSWFKDYLYIPLGGSRVGKGRHIANLMVTFVVSGLWHGANWTFLVWGVVHGVYQSVAVFWHRLFGNGVGKNRVSRLLGIVVCFLLVDFAWIFFRANTMSDAVSIVSKIFTDFGKPYIDVSSLTVGCASLCLLAIKDFSDTFGCKIHALHSSHIIVRYASFIFLVCYILLFGSLSGGQFIYFQF